MLCRPMSFRSWEFEAHQCALSGSTVVSISGWAFVLSKFVYVQQNTP
jgi:hypothetical protein